MNVDYNDFAKTFSKSRKNMKWEEIEYFLSFLEWEHNLKILDIWCWNWRFLSHIKEQEVEYNEYLWVDLSELLLEEASIFHPEARFLQLNMLDLDLIKDKFDNIFFLASFHHLDTIEKRLEVLKKTYSILENWWFVYMTNWALNSDLNKEKYSKSIIKDSENKFWSIDYNIKIWEFSRYYHCFSLEELEYLFKQSWFKIIENRLFENNKNFVCIIKKV